MGRFRGAAHVMDEYAKPIFGATFFEPSCSYISTPVALAANHDFDALATGSHSSVSICSDEGSFSVVCLVF